MTSHSQQNTKDLKDKSALAEKVLTLLFRYRRHTGSDSLCSNQCKSCQNPHFDKLLNAITSSMPITFVLPAFPGKSPNSYKVLSPLPDLAEQLALQFLEDLCQKITEIYPPGAKVLLCSDGRVFSDIIGIEEIDVTNYQKEIAQIIHEFGLKSLSTFSLDTIDKDIDFAQMRQNLMNDFGVSSEILKEKIKNGSKLSALKEEIEFHRMYCGITKFLFEDSIHPNQTKSRSTIQRESKSKAIEVIRRSNAWSEFIAHQFPQAVRLSIHPQLCGSKKIGIRLIRDESWITPWHGVTVKMENTFTLMKRSEAEKIGAKLIYTTSNRPSHFELLRFQQ